MKNRHKGLSIIKRDFVSWLLLLPSFLCFTFIVWQPLISGIILSFFKTAGYDAVRFIGLQNYYDVVQDAAFMSAFKNSFIYLMWSLIIGFLLPIVVALILNELVHCNDFLKLSFYFPTMVPGVAAALLWYFMFDPGQGGVLNIIFKNFGLGTSQWLNNPKLTIPLIIVTMTWRGFGSAALIYLASLQGISQELYEAASIEGASIWERLKAITLPQISDIVGLMFIMQVIGVFQVMYEPLTMTDGGPNNASTSLMLESYLYAFRYFEAGKSMAIGTITFLILGILTIIYQLYTKKTRDIGA